MVNQPLNLERKDAAPASSMRQRNDPERTEDPGGAVRRDPYSVLHTPHDGSGQSPPGQWLDLHGDALYKYALLLVGNEHHAEDLVQETLLAALKSRGGYSVAASERTWLIAILRNKAIDKHRRDRRQNQYLADMDAAVEGNFNWSGKWVKAPNRWAPNPQSHFELQEFWSVFHDCMRALPRPIGEAFALRVVEGLDAAETCRILEINRPNLWTMLYRARERLRRCLESKWLVEGEM
jgi:RNA polymerase sigma-70 factor, ECF subfamily